MATFKKVGRNLSLADLGLVGKDIVATMKDGEEQRVAVMLGVANSYQAKPSRQDPTNESVAFAGQFRGINILTGEVIERGRAFMPGFAAELLRSFVDAADGEPVEFAFAINLKKDPSTPTGYRFTVEAAEEPKQSDTLSEIAARVGVDMTQTKALPAPTAAKATKAKKAAK